MWYVESMMKIEDWFRVSSKVELPSQVKYLLIFFMLKFQFLSHSAFHGSAGIFFLLIQ